MSLLGSGVEGPSVRIETGALRFLVSKNVQTSSWAHPTSYSVGTDHLCVVLRVEGEPVGGCRAAAPPQKSKFKKNAVFCEHDYIKRFT